MIKWWNSRKQNTKITIAATILIPLLGICFGLVGAIIGGNLPYIIGLPKELSQEKMPPFMTESLIAEASILTATYSDENVYIISPNCWQTNEEKLNTIIKGVDFAEAELYFEVLARKEKILITDISIFLDSYNALPDNIQLTDYSIKLGQFTDPTISSKDLGEIDIFPSNKIFQPAIQESIEIPEQEAIGFGILASFHQPGEYILHLELLTTDYWHNEVKLISPPLKLSWVNYPDLSDISFHDSVNSRELQLGSCK